MKGVILAGGLGTRLNPLTFVTNKHLLPVYDKPMIYYPIETLVKGGITEVLIVTSGPHVGHFLGLLKNGKEFGLTHLEYAIKKNPMGELPTLFLSLAILLMMNRSPLFSATTPPMLIFLKLSKNLNQVAIYFYVKFPILNDTALSNLIQKIKAKSSILLKNPPIPPLI